MSKVKFIHTADLHLGAPLLGIPNNEKLKDAVNKSFEKSIDFAIDRGVDFYIISGDIFDRPNISYEDYSYFTNQLKRLDVPVFVCAGNHDPIESWEITKAYGPLPKNVYFFDAEKPQSFVVKDCLVTGKSFQELKDPTNQRIDKLFEGYRYDNNNCNLAVGVLHTGLETDVYIESVKKQDLDNLGYDYWALGHVHKRAQYNLNKSTIVFPGCIQGLHINAESPNGVYYVELDENGCKTEFIPTSFVTWKKINVDISECQNIDEVLALCKKQFDCKNLCTRIYLQGKTKLHKDIKTDTLKYLQEALCSNDVYCQKVIDETLDDVNEEALIKEGRFPACVLRAELNNIEEEKHKFSIPYKFEEKLDLQKIEQEAKQQALDLLEIDA